MNAPGHGWRGPHAWRLTSRTDHANGNSSLGFRCHCGAWERVTRLPTEDADLAIQDRVDHDEEYRCRR